MALTATDITLRRRDFQLRATLTIGQETVALVGPSGAGKTSLLRTIAGLEQPHTGQITLDAEAWFDATRKINLRPERRHVGYLPQDYALFPHLTVAGNIRFAARRDRPDLLDRLRISHLGDATPTQLSGGERQRAALARALARDPRVLLLDEPFGALDPLTRAHVRDELADILTDVALPTLLVTHSFPDATALAHRIGVLDHGAIVQIDTPARIHRQPATALVAQLTGANILAGTATPTTSGAQIAIDGGGQLHTNTSAAGRVHIAVQPWAVTLTDPHYASLVDTVLDIRHHGGTLELRLTRLCVQLPARQIYPAAVTPGTLIGLKVAPEAIYVLPAGQSDISFLASQRQPSPAAFSGGSATPPRSEGAAGHPVIRPLAR